MKKSFLGILFLVLLLAACNSGEKEEVNLLDPIEVEIKTTELVGNEDYITQAMVTQVGKPVSDASEVIFEIWQHGEPDTYRSLDGKNKGNGVYEVAWTIEDEGVYYIFYHVTARGMHRMEKHRFVIGDVDVDEILATPDERPQNHMN